MAAQARLDVKVTGDASGALKAIQSVRAAGNEAATKFREQSKEAIGAVVRSLNPIVLAGTAAASAIMGVGQKISEYFEEGREAVKKAGEELTKNAEAAGVTEQAYQQLRSAAEKAGVAQDEFNAKMQALKEGKQTVSELVEEWGKLPEKVELTTDAIERYQLEASALRQKEEAAAEERKANLSDATDADLLYGEAMARIDRGEPYAAVMKDVIDKYASRDWYTLGLTTNDDELLDGVNRVDLELLRRDIQRRNDKYEQRVREREAEQATRAAQKEWAAEKDRLAKEERRKVWQEINQAGGAIAWAVGRAAHDYGLDADSDLIGLADSIRAKRYIRDAQELSREFGMYDSGPSAGQLASAYTQQLKKRKAEQEAAAAKQAEEAKKKKAKEDEEKRKADEEKRKADEAADKQREALKARRKELREWYKQAKAEAESYSGGYQNSFGLAFGGGDLIGAGRYRAVTRMTEAQKQLQVAEKLLEVNRQMNEKLKALEE